MNAIEARNDPGVCSVRAIDVACRNRPETGIPGRLLTGASHLPASGPQMARGNHATCRVLDRKARPWAFPTPRYSDSRR